MAVKVLEDLEVWKEARRLTQVIYQLTKNESFYKDFALRDQIRRAAMSIMSNIAEGFERGGNQELIQFLYVGKASCGEVRSQIYVALDQNYVASKEVDELTNSFKRLSSMISNFITYLRKSGMKGEKFRKPELSPSMIPILAVERLNLERLNQTQRSYYEPEIFKDTPR